jgi:CheY-like chemotaxis protein
MKRRLRLIHANANEAKERVALLREAGYTVAFDTVTPKMLQKLRKRPPDAVVIDLSRAPSVGRDIALDIRSRKATRHLPIVFLGGDPAKVVITKIQVPDAVFAPWSRHKSAIKRARAAPPRDPVVPPSIMAGYSGTPLVKKLGLKSGFTVALVSAPDYFEGLLTPLPENVTFRRSARGKRDLTIWFTTSHRDLQRRIAAFASAVGDGAIWIVWPKQSSGVVTDVTQNDVRGTGLANGLVDFKICAIDETWSGLKFSRRKR